MATKRMVKTSLPKSKKMRRLKDDTTRLLFYMLCVSCDDDGKMDADPGDIRADLFGGRDEIKIQDVNNMLTDIESQGLIIFYQDKTTKETYLSIPGWTKINKIPEKRHQPSELPCYSKEIHTLLTKCIHSVNKCMPSIEEDSIEEDRKEQILELEILPSSNNNLTKEQKAKNFVLPLKEEILNFSLTKIEECIEILCYKITFERVWDEVYKFKGKNLKSCKNERAILHVLIAIYTAKKKPDDYWKYATSILSKEDLTYNERDNTKNSQ